MKAVIVVKMKEGYLVLPYAGDLAGIDPSNGRAVEKSGWDSAGIGKAVESVFVDMVPPPPAKEKEDSDVPF